jgi:hypothetical protein
VRVTQSFSFCVVLYLPLISPVLNEVRVTQSFAFCVVLNTTQKGSDWVTRTSLRTGDIRGKHNTKQKANDWVTSTSLRTEDIRFLMRCVLLNRLLSVWCCAYPWYPRFLMRCVLLNRFLSVWCCVYLWYPRFKGNDWETRTSLRTGDIRGKHNTTQRAKGRATRTSLKFGDIKKNILIKNDHDHD